MTVPPSTLPETAPPRTEDALWAAVRDRDPVADGSFVYAVTTTGVFCRPSCAARTPRRPHVRFYDDPPSAVAGGFRPCARCRPDLPPARVREARAIARVCRWLEEVDGSVPVAQAADRVGMSRHHFQRVFRRVTGTTPAAYRRLALARRLAPDLRSQPRASGPLPRHGSAARVHATAVAHHGMTPGAIRAGGVGERLRVAVAPCALGHLLLGATSRGVARVALGDDPEELRRALARDLPNAELDPPDARAATWLAELVAHLEGTAGGPVPDLPLDVRGTAFQCRVWTALRTIPPGKPISYGELARRVGRPAASRAVAQACGKNPLALLIPCHRVLGTDGRLRGYRWGVDRKARLLQGEARPRPLFNAGGFGAS